MKTTLVLIFSIFIFTACSNKQEQNTPQNLYSFNNFDYTKKQINFYEKEFQNVLKIDNPKILREYANFYYDNSSYFLNGKEKVKKIIQRIDQIKNKKNNTLLKLEEAQKQSRKEALKIYRELAKQGNIKAQRKLVNEYKIKYPDLALEILEKLVKDEDIKSMKEYASANIYIVRPVQEQNYKKALETYEKLAKLGELSSIMRLGNFYEYGYHKDMVKQDKQKALKYYELAASKGYTKAKKKLLKIYSCKKCKPNRYNEKKAKKLKKELLAEINLKLSTVLTKKDEKPIIKTNIVQESEKKTKQKQMVEKQKIEENELVTLTPKKGIKQKLLQTVKCYDMKTSKSGLSEKCKNDTDKVISELKKISKIAIIPVIDKSDIIFYDKEVSKEKLKNSLLTSLARNRQMDMVWYLRGKIKDDSIINISTYHVISKKQNKGVILKFY